MSENIKDNEYFKEVTAQRKHEQELARIQSDEKVRLAEIEYRNKMDRRDSFLKPVILGFAIFLCLVVVFGGVVSCVNNSDESREEKVKACIAAGNEWRDGSSSAGITDLCVKKVPVEKAD